MRGGGEGLETDGRPRGGRKAEVTFAERKEALRRPKQRVRRMVGIIGMISEVEEVGMN